MKGNIFDIQHFSVHDGPGIRSTVFLKGCQLRCLWCHNPESIFIRPHELSFVAGNCIGCGKCFIACKQNAHKMENSVHIIDRQKCIRCGECVPECPTKALSLCGREVDTDDVIKEVLHDKAYYQDEGGMTISGGEPLMQREFTKELISLAKKDAVNVALETNVCYDYSWLDGIRENVDLFLVDWKETDLNKHYEFTKASNEKILSNIQRLHDEDYSVLVRCPIIPGYNDTEEHFNKIADMTKSMPKLLGAEIIPYHNLGILKFERFGLEEELKYITLEQPDTQVVNQWIQYIRDRGGRLVNDSI